jgi:hypothetical protein
MPNWLIKATGGAARDGRDAPQTFQLTCECSERHTGQRLGRPQRIICQKCGSALFVLPRNSYPAIKSSSAASKSRKRRRKAAPVPSIGPALPSAHDVANSMRRGVAGAAGSVSSGLHSAANGTWNWIIGLFAAVVRAVYGFCTPFRLIVMGIALVLLATAAVAVRSHRMESARQTLRSELEAGQTALSEADYVTARGHFSEAAEAVHTLGSDDPQSRLVRQLHRETTAITQLAPGSLFDMLDELERQQQRPGASKWEDIFNVRYKGTWLVLQTPVRRESTGWVVDLPLWVGQEHRQVIIQVDEPAFDRLPASEAGVTALFAAPITGCRLDESAGQWLVTLGGENGFLWSTLENLRPLGLLDDVWTSQEEITALLEAQSRLTGGTP